MLGIIGANVVGLLYKKYSAGLIGNSIAGVFGSIFLIKSLGRLGFDPSAIMQSGIVHTKLFIINALVSISGGILAIFLSSLLRNKMDKS